MRASVAALALLVSTGLVGCDTTGSDDPASSAPEAAPPSSSTSVPSAPLSESPLPSEVAVRPGRAPMPDVPARAMFVHGGLGTVVSASGRESTGVPVSAYVVTRRGVVFVSGDRVLELVPGTSPTSIGRVAAGSALLVVDPTRRFVMWRVLGQRADRQRTVVWDTVERRVVLDRFLDWRERAGDPRWVLDFGDRRLRLVHPARGTGWTFATRSGPFLVVAAGPVLDRRSGPVPVPTDDLGTWSPGLRFRLATARGVSPWTVTDAGTGGDVTPPDLGRVVGRGSVFTGWLGNRTFGLVTSRGTWRDTRVTGWECRVGGGCDVVLRYRLGADDGGLLSSNEIG